MTPLKQQFLKRIEATGPIPLADYMAECLMHPKHGYYQQQKVFGAKGDFITAPEVSQMFGEVLGLWAASVWQSMGCPKFSLVELGPGRGTLMADMLRAAKALPGFLEAAQVHFIETSTQLRALQKEKVPHATWHDSMASLPAGPALFIANEFFDALPIHQFEKQKGKWHERAVGAYGDNLGLMLTQAGPKLALIPPPIQKAPGGSIAEVCPAGLAVAADIAGHIAEHSGAALFIDYGYATSAPGDTFQALKAHKYVDPFSEPGLADLTAHVAFDQLATAAAGKGARPSAIISQGQFLMTIGLGVRAQALASKTDEAGQQRILSELKRLTAPDEMGTLFKVLALMHPKLPSPAGF